MKEKTWDYLPGTDIYLYQYRDMFRINTDTALLAKFMRIVEGESVLDIGTNNGALLLYAKQYRPSYLYGVDIQEEACILARENLAYHKVENVCILHGDIKDMKLDQMDVIICNPPYFKVNELKQVNQNMALRYARHECYLDLESLTKKVYETLKDTGRFYMIHRSDRIIDIVYFFRKYNLEIKKMQFVFDEQIDEARSVLIEAVKNAKVKCTVVKPHIITR